MNINEFDFNLPEKLIAQTPLENRASSKLLVMDKLTGDVTHKTFSDIVELLSENDVLVLNNTRVIPARLYGAKKDTNAKIELLMLKEKTNDHWECLVKPAKRIKVGSVITFGNGELEAICIEKKDEGIVIVKLVYDGILLEILESLGEMPLPPYIKEKLEEQERYQTVYSKISGSAAAPTAGLHLTKDILNKLKEKNVDVIYVTLHVGLGTFRPVKVDNINDHTMHEEEYEISKESANRLNNALKENKNIISVGTTSTRVLESAYDNGFKEERGSTDIFIYPGYKFKVVNKLITNFHLPKSTLLMLISALSTKTNIFNAYKEAIENKYRFFSFGDSMFIK